MDEATRRRALAEPLMRRKFRPVAARTVKRHSEPRPPEKEPLTPGLRPKERSHVETFGFYPLREGDDYAEDFQDAGKAGRGRKAR
jgi:hypothetical protein